MDSVLMVDRMYYIVDGRGNYYCVNNEDQLIVSQNSGSADLFTLKEANKRINNGRRMKFYSIVPADDVVYEDELDAVEGEDETALEQENVAGEEKFAMEQERINEEVEPILEREDSDDEENQKVLIEEAKTVVKEQISAEIKEVQYEYDLDRLDWKEFLTHLSFVISGLKKYQDKMNDELSQADMCICDLLHYLELYDLSEEDYIKASILLKQYRDKRRVAKDKYHIAEWFQNAIGTKANLTKVKNVLKQIDGLEHRVYSPRMLPEIFEDAKLRTHEKEQPEEMPEEYFEISEEYEMTNEDLVRRETKFDAGENDWLRMAKEQAQFFAEAKQYACNLRIALDEIEDEIEFTMREVEETNYNAAEGYKTLKKLQNLRNERKRVKNELDSVLTITNCFACDEMYDAYRYCEDRIREIQG